MKPFKGILLYFRILGRLLRNSLLGENYPFFLLAFITSQCSRKALCHSCWRTNDIVEQKHMSLETMRKIVKAKIPIITLSGGEPTEHPLFYEIVREIETQKIALNIITNCENTDLIIKTVKKKKNTNVIVSINQYDNPSRIRFIEEHVQLLTKEKFRVYLNIPVDCNNIDFNVVHRFQNLLKSVNRIYITKYVIDECNISTSDFENIKKLALYIKKNFAIANVMYTIPCSRSMLYVANFFAWLIGETFDPCSGYPFRSTVNERGVYVKCLREKKNAR